jgi:hypothetical protein
MTTAPDYEPPTSHHEELMTDDRRTILEMLANGQINADEAERLLAALDKPSAAAGSAPPAKPRAKYLRVEVDEEAKINDEGKRKGPIHVNLRVPMQLLRAGVKLTSLIPPQAQESINDALSRQKFTDAAKKGGVSTIDLSAINPENLGEIIDQLEDLTLDMDEGGKTKIRLFCE